MNLVGFSVGKIVKDVRCTRDQTERSKDERNAGVQQVQAEGGTKENDNVLDPLRWSHQTNVIKHPLQFSKCNRAP